MATLREISERLKLLSANEVVNRLFKILKDNETHFIEAQKLQWGNNTDREGFKFPNYAVSTEKKWRYADPPSSENFSYKVTTNSYNLKWSNDLVNNLFLNVSESEGANIGESEGANVSDKKAVFDSKMKEDELEKRAFLERIKALGLTKENLGIIIQTYILPQFNKQVKETLGL